MPISAPGAPERRVQNGYTLVELLVVLTILGLLSGAVVTVLPDGKGAARAEAERFAARAKHAQDKAVLESRSVSVRISSAGYGFDSRAGRDWIAQDGEPLTETRWRDGVAPLLPNGKPVRVAFDPTGIAEPWRLALRDAEDQVAVEIREDGRIHVLP